MAVYAVVMVSAFFAGIVGMFAGAGTIGAGGPRARRLDVVHVVLQILLPNHGEMAQSWLVYETICGRERSYAGATGGGRRQRDDPHGSRLLLGGQ